MRVDFAAKARAQRHDAHGIDVSALKLHAFDTQPYAYASPLVGVLRVLFQKEVDLSGKGFAGGLSIYFREAGLGIESQIEVGATAGVRVC